MLSSLSTLVADIDSLVECYQRDGFSVVRSLFKNEDILSVHAALDRYFLKVVPSLPPSDVVFEADRVSVRNLWRMEQYDPFFAGLACRPELIELVSKLVGGHPVLMGVEMFCKPARVGSGVPPHQDNAYFCQTPPDVLTVWIAVDRVTEANGPIYYVRGSHKEMLPHKPSGVSGNSMGLAADFDKSDPFVGVLDPGDALLHHCQTVHFSGANRTDVPRRGLLMVFRGSHTRDDVRLKSLYETGRATT